MLDRTAEFAIATAEWLRQFENRLVESRFVESRLANADQAGLRPLFHPESYWRDLLALSWNLQTRNGADAIPSELQACAMGARPHAFRIDPNRAAPRLVTRAGTDAIEAIFRFETVLGRGSGILRLTPNSADGHRLKAWTLLTALDELKGFEEQLGRSRPRGQAYSRDFRGPNWLDQRREALESAPCRGGDRRQRHS